jgi:hypothetical protein
LKLIINKRKLFKYAAASLIAAPAIIRLARGQNFASFQNSISRFSGQFKPSGFPVLNKSHSLAPDLFYGFDTGNLSYIELTGTNGRSMQHGSYGGFTNLATAAGTAINWPGGDGTAGVGWFCQTDTTNAEDPTPGMPSYTGPWPVWSAQALSLLGTGAGFSMICGVWLTGTNVLGSLLFGRPRKAHEAQKPLPITNSFFGLDASNVPFVSLIQGNPGELTLASGTVVGSTATFASDPGCKIGQELTYPPNLNIIDNTVIQSGASSPYTVNTTGNAETPADSIRLSGVFTGSIAASPGNIVNIASTQFGTMNINDTIVGTNILPGTRIISNLGGGNWGIAPGGQSAASTTIITRSIVDFALTGLGALSQNAFHMLGLSVQNNSTGSATATFYVDGLSVATASGLAVLSTINHQNFNGGNWWFKDNGLFQDSEEQFMLGSDFHQDTTIARIITKGCVFFGGMKSRAYTAGEHSNLFNNPYQFLQ